MRWDGMDRDPSQAKPRPFPTGQIQNRDFPKTHVDVMGLVWVGMDGDGDSPKGFGIWD